MFCLVLSGGGTKGVYHIGVWRALRELEVQVDAFIGVSIGALIAGFLAQGLDDVLEEIRKTMVIDNMLALPEELVEHGEIKLDKNSIHAVRKFLTSTLEKKGLDSSPLRMILETKLDEERIRASGKDLGIVTVNISDLHSQEVFLEDMEKGFLVDYLMASAAFPGFEQPVIEGKKYIDGGLYDNIPYAMARKRGYRNIIVSDTSGLGRNRKPQIEGTRTIYIKNSIDFGSVFDFDRKFMDSFTLLGYLDTLRTFGKLSGYSYFIEPNSRLEATFISEWQKSGISFPVVPERMRYDRNKILVFLECAASILQVDRISRYTYESLIQAIELRRIEIEASIDTNKSSAPGGLRSLAPTIKASIRNHSFSECPYYYYRTVQEAFSGSVRGNMLKMLTAIYPELVAGVVWLEQQAKIGSCIHDHYR